MNTPDESQEATKEKLLSQLDAIDASLTTEERIEKVDDLKKTATEPLWTESP